MTTALLLEAHEPPDDDLSVDEEVDRACRRCGNPVYNLTDDHCTACRAEDVRRARTQQRQADPKLRQPRATPAPVAPAWWVGKPRDEFSSFAATRAEQLQRSPEAAKVKTPMNFVE